MSWIDTLLSKDLLPDPILRFGIRRLLAERLRSEDPGSPQALESKLQAFADDLASGPLAVHTQEANAQHYEVPTEFFHRVLGKRLKYSSALFEPDCHDLDRAEEAMLHLTVRRAQLADGQDILELGCGWGSLSLFMAEHFPNSKILAISNSATQKQYIDDQAEQRGFRNLEVRTVDVRHLTLERRFDRVVSVEMFEHLRDYRQLLQNIASWLHPEGKLFVHIFCHRRLAYRFEARDAGDWMARYFFTGGLMPSADLLGRFDGAMVIEAQWDVDGQHYQKTSLAWLSNMDRQREHLLPILNDVYGADEQRRWWVYWRVFFLSCAELFGFREGQEWMVNHYRLVRRAS